MSHENCFINECPHTQKNTPLESVFVSSAHLITTKSRGYSDNQMMEPQLISFLETNFRQKMVIRHYVQPLIYLPEMMKIERIHFFSIFSMKSRGQMSAGKSRGRVREAIIWCRPNKEHPKGDPAAKGGFNFYLIRFNS